jgi:hypothetical protein
MIKRKQIQAQLWDQIRLKISGSLYPQVKIEVQRQIEDGSWGLLHTALYGLEEMVGSGIYGIYD